MSSLEGREEDRGNTFLLQQWAIPIVDFGGMKGYNEKGQESGRKIEGGDSK